MFMPLDRLQLKISAFSGKFNVCSKCVVSSWIKICRDFTFQSQIFTQKYSRWLRFYSEFLRKKLATGGSVWENWCWKTAIIADGKGSYFETTRILLTAVKCTQLHLKRAKGWLCTAIPVLQHNKWGKTVSPQEISLRVLKHEGQQRVIKEVSGLNGDWSIKLPYFGNSREFCARDCSISPKRHQICRWSGGGTTTPGSSPSL